MSKKCRPARWYVSHHILSVKFLTLQATQLLFQEFARLADEAEEENQAALRIEAARLKLLPPILADDASLDAYDLPALTDAQDIFLDYRRTVRSFQPHPVSLR